MSAILKPGEARLETEIIRAPNAYPASVTGQTAAGAKVFVIGGLTKLETAAIHIAAGLAAHGLYESLDCAHRAVDIAAQVLKAAALRERGETSEAHANS